MNMAIRLTSVIILLMCASTLVQAKPSDQNTEYKKYNKNRPHQRPSFDVLDLNANGEITYEEFSANNIPHGDHQTIFNKIDTDINGAISQDEFLNHKPRPRKMRQGEKS